LKIPRKAKGQINKLVPSNDPDKVRAVRMVFELYTKVGLSQRQISVRLNAEGLRFNGRPFTQPDVRYILCNAAYAGHTHFGKVQRGTLSTFDGKGLIIEVKGKRADRNRSPAECLVRENTHEPLIDRVTWERAQAKLAGEEGRTSHSPRNPAYYLKQIFVCGHCGQGMVGRTENFHGRQTILYVCGSYVAGKCNGYPTDCGYQRIEHTDAERLLLDKIAELDLPLDDSTSEAARANVHARLDQLRFEGLESIHRLERWIAEGVRALSDYLDEVHGPDEPAFRWLRELARHLYQRVETTGRDPKGLRLDLEAFKQAIREAEIETPERDPEGLCLDLAAFKQAIQEAEAAAVRKAQTKLEELALEHRAFTRAWALANDFQQGVLKEEMERLEKEMAEWRERAIPLAERLDALHKRLEERAAERKKLLAEWPTLEGREKGEALRRLFKTVTLFWEKTYHPPAAKPTRPHKTARRGRYSYTLQRDRIKWAFVKFDSISSC
jgi:hypothetical protein